MAEEATLTLPDGTSYQIKIQRGTIGPPALDMSTLYGTTGYFSHDPGFKSTSSCLSSITYIDGVEDQLLHRGYNIKDLVQNCSYTEHCYLLLYGELPTAEELETFNKRLQSEMCIHQNLVAFYKSFSTTAHPMAIMVGVVGSLSAFMPTAQNMDRAQREQVAIQIVAKMPMIAAVAYRTAMGLPVAYPKREYSFGKNLLYMMFADPMDDPNRFKFDPMLVKALEKVLILHADHEQNVSTSTVRIAGSSQANPYACIAAGIASLWGPMHGGANERVLEQLRQIGGEENIEEFFHKVTVEKSERLMGFGLRVYTENDPRNDEIKKIAEWLLQSEYLNSTNRQLLDLALKVEARAMSDDYFISRKLFPNVDYYTGIILNCLGIPSSMFTVIFAVARTIGWISQWAEMMSQPNNRISRPRQLYVGETVREFEHLDDRELPESLLSLSEAEKERLVHLPTMCRKRSVWG